MTKDEALSAKHEGATTVALKLALELERLAAALRERLAEGKHITDGQPCWCGPEVIEVDPVTGASVVVHKDDTAHHAEQLARLGWQYFECPACGSEGARAFPVSSPIYVAEVDMPDPEDSPGYTELAQPDVDRRSTESKETFDQQEPVVWMYQNKSTHEVRFQKHMRSFVDHGAWYEVPLYSEPLANQEKTSGSPKPAKTEALRLADAMEYDLDWCDEAAAELRRMHDLLGKANALCRIRAEEIERLKAQPEHSPNCALLKIPSKDCDCQDQQEPVAITITGKLGNIYSFTGDYSLKKGDKVYTTPPSNSLNSIKSSNTLDAQRTWVGLTDEEVITMSRYDLEYAALIGEVERKLKEKNS